MTGMTTIEIEEKDWEKIASILETSGILNREIRLGQLVNTNCWYDFKILVNNLNVLRLSLEAKGII